MRNKILFILHLPPPIHGSSVVGQYIRDSVLINQKRDIHYLNLSTSRTVNEIGKNPIKKGWRYIEILVKVLRELTVSKLDVCYLAMVAKGVGFYKDAVIAIIIKLFRKKLVIHFHNKGIKQRQNKWPDNWFYRWVFRDAEIILLSKYLYSDVEKYVDKEQVHYCPNGIPELKKSGQSKRKINNENTTQILFLSNLIESKGVYSLHHACSILNEKGLPFKCTFVGNEGDISKSNFEREVIKLGLKNVVEFVGPKYGDDKIKYFEESDIFTLPTYNDCFPLVLLEAMQFGLPIITTPEGGIRDIVQDEENGFLVPQNDAVALANKLELLINNPELRKEMGQKGRKSYEEKFTLEAFEKRFDQILQSIEKSIQ